MNTKIKQALLKQFEKHRIIFWYDRQKELRADFEALDLEGVEKVVLDNNEFILKHRLLRGQPAQKFLLYHEGAQPDDRDNWLLDILLAYGEFRTDQVSIWLGELELGPEYTDVIKDHIEFYKLTKRVEALKKQVKPNDSLEVVRLKLLAVCVEAPPQLDEILEKLLAEHASDRDEAEKLIGRCNLSAFLWKRVAQDYGYQPEAPNIKDFAIALFQSCYRTGLGGNGLLDSASVVFFKRWKNNRQNSEAFETLSARCADLFRIEQDLEERDYHTLIALDYYELIDQKVISGLVKDVLNQAISIQECKQVVDERRTGYWYEGYKDLYLAIGYASQFLAALSSLPLTMTSLADGVQRYAKDWFIIDQLYRKFTYHVRTASQQTLMQSLSTRIENLYTNSYLLKLNDHWQTFVDQAESWPMAGVLSQRDFFTRCVQPYLERHNKIFVIISDALRYEIAEEFVHLILAKDRYEAEIEPMVAVLPSYTQLGMAALLPHERLNLDPDRGSAVIFIDDEKDTRGTENRSKILAQAAGGVAIQAEDLMQMNREQIRDHIKGCDVVYVYHNHIDKTGDTLASEGRVFEAVEKTLDELLKLVNKLQSSGNAYNFLLTADHGFIYQNNELDESDFLSEPPKKSPGMEINRRFVIGRTLHPHNSLKAFSAAQLGLKGDFEVQFPKSINRLRQSGSGSRYVHGGIALQEVVIPVVSINKKRVSDIRQVGVSIIRGTGKVITSGQLTVKLYQKEAVSEKIQRLTLRIGLYNQANKLISDSQELIFDSTSENEREREKAVRLILSKEADAANNSTVYVKLLEREDGTSFDKDYEVEAYTLRLSGSFTRDFDF